MVEYEQECKLLFVFYRSLWKGPVMFSRSAAEDSRVVIRLDFTLVIPGGMSYSMDPEEIGDRKVLEFTDGNTVFSLDAPVPTGLDGSYRDPVTRGVIRNHVAGRIRKIYGREVMQVVIVQEPRLLVISADKSDAQGAVHFFIAGDQGIYHGTLSLPKGKIKEKDRLDAVQALFATIGEYSASPDEKAKKARELAAARQQLEQRDQEKEAPAEKETAKAAEQKAPEQEAAKQAAPDQDAPAAAPEKEKKQSAPAAPAAQKKEETGKEENREEAKPKQEEAPHLTPEELRIRTLEQQRQKRIEQLRAKYTGNPGVETQIDNYIARCERTADQVVSEFTSYIASVQNYAAQTSFTGTEDPNYKAMLSDIQEAADSLGSQMDQVAQSADENAQNAKDAGIREPYVERLVRLMDRLDKKYEAFFVSMGGGSVLNEIRYHRPEEISQIFRKWRNVRYSLPSWIEQSEGEIEEAAKDEIQKRILAARDAIPALEAELEEREAAAKTFEEAIPEKESEYDASLRSVEDRRKALELQKEEKRRTYHEKLGSMQQELEEREAEEERLKAHLEKTLSINVGKKRDLQTKLTNVRNDIEERHGRIRELQEQGTQIGTAEDQELAALEEQEAKLQKERAALSTELEAQKQETEKIRSQIAESHRAIEEGEEEFRHVHENYLLGKYDRTPE